MKLLWLILFLALLLLACNGDGEDICGGVWRACPTGDSKICRNCRLVRVEESELLRFGLVKDCRTGWEKRVAIPLSCEFEER